MLNEILAVSGKSGLFKLVSKTKNFLIIESLIDNKRIPVNANDKVISLGNLSIYTDDGEVPVHDVFSAILKKEEGKSIPFDAKDAQPEELRAYLAEVLPNFNRERVYPSDIKKTLKWYDLLIANGITDFSKEEDEEKPAEEATVENEPATPTPTPTSTSTPTPSAKRKESLKASQPAKVAKAKPTPKTTTPKRSVVGAKRGG